MVRGWVVRRRYQRIRVTVMALQRYSRGYLARKHYKFLKETKAACLIQTRWRGFITKRRYIALRKTALGLQRFGRGVLARRKFLCIKEHMSAITIQRFCRGFLTRRWYNLQRRQVIIVQSLVRRFLAKRLFKKLKIEARSVEHVKKLNIGLERKIIELQQKIQDLNGEMKILKQLDSGRNEYKQEHEKLEIEAKNLRNQIKLKVSEILKLNGNLTAVQNQNSQLQEKLKKDFALIQELQSNNAQIRQTFNSKAVDTAVMEMEKQLREKFEKEKKLLIDERENERASRQQLLRKYYELEEKYEMGLEGEKGGVRSPGIYYLI